MAVKNVIDISFSKSNTKYIKDGYIKLVRNLVNNLEVPQLVIKDVHSANVSESVYVSFKLDSTTEKQLGLDNSVYMGCFVISGHRRLYKTTMSTFYTQQAKDLDELGTVITKELLNSINDESIVNKYIVTLPDDELEVLRIIDEAQYDKRLVFEVDPIAFTRDRVFPVFVKKRGNRNTIATIKDMFSSQFLNSLRTKGCLYGVPVENNNNFSAIAITSTGREILSEYGSETSEDLWSSFEESYTFNLWGYTEVAKPIVDRTELTYTPTEEELQDLGITLDWYSEYEERFTLIVAEERLSNNDTKIWVSRLSEFITQWLPEDKDLIYGSMVSKNHSGAFYIGIDNPETTDELFYMLTINPKQFLISSEATSIHTYGFNGIEFLQSLREQLDAQVESDYMVACTEEDIKVYLMLKQLERSNVAVVASKSVINYTRAHLEPEETLFQVRLLRNQQGGEIISNPVSGAEMQSIIRLISKYNYFGLWAMSAPKTNNTLIRVHSTEATDEVFRYFQGLMPYVSDDIIKDDQPFLPIVCGMALGRVEFLKPSVVFNV